MGYDTGTRRIVSFFCAMVIFSTRSFLSKSSKMPLILKTGSKDSSFSNDAAIFVRKSSISTGTLAILSEYILLASNLARGVIFIAPIFTFCTFRFRRPFSLRVGLATMVTTSSAPFIFAVPINTMLSGTKKTVGADKVTPSDS